MIAGDIAAELDITASTLSHHLDRLEARGRGERAAGRHVPLVHREHRRPRGPTAFPVRGVLHAQPRNQPGQTHIRQALKDLTMEQDHRDRSREIRRSRPPGGLGPGGDVRAAARPPIPAAIRSRRISTATQKPASCPTLALQASLGCGNPTALAELKPGETVLDLGIRRRHRRAALAPAASARPARPTAST